MQLTQEQVAAYDRDGFLVFPDLISPAEIALLRQDLRRAAAIPTEEVVREKTGAVRTVFRVHHPDSPTASLPFQRLATLPRVLRPAQQVLRDDALYVYHSKCNLKEAIDGEIWQWHQDYGSWQLDGVPTPNMATSLLMLDEATEIGGCLYFIPGSHKLGRVPAVLDDKTTSYKLWKIPTPRLIEIMEECGDSVPITGKAGTVVLFHCNILHGSGHNMSRHSRWHIYTVYNPVANRPGRVENPRPEWVVSRDHRPLRLGSDHDIVGIAQAAE
ncbi:MAG: phytanoyl-CoA dioxygenase family protein [Alphaproteobacteria bacterium]|nr:phytanoyl-CoA dioxygenase family protein [Alphaproteobacteria bacterium]